jgi:uncharacterized membrane protein
MGLALAARRVMTLRPRVGAAGSVASLLTTLRWQSRAQPAGRQRSAKRAVSNAAPLGARVADRVTGFMGSWRFIVIQSVIVAIWLWAIVVLLSRPFDPFPFILLNLAFSTQAAYAAPLILLAGNRASHRDRLTLEHAADEGDLGDAQNERLLAGNTEILKQVAALEARILTMEETILAAVRPTDESRLTASRTTGDGVGPEDRSPTRRDDVPS